VALEAEGPHVRKIALAAALGDGDDVVGIPEVASKTPFLLELPAGCVVELALIAAEGFGVHTAPGANTAIAGEDLFAEISWISPQFPLVDAVTAAEGAATTGNIRSTPSAREAFTAYPTARHDAASAHTRRS
jgi:hypothetical protein